MSLRRYNLPSRHLEGWAIVVIDTDGYFSTVSDYGNYAYRWGSMGVDDLRKFLVSCDGAYVLGKISPGYEFDAKETTRALREMVIRERRAREIDADQARDAYERARVYNDVELFDWFNQYPGSLPDDHYEARCSMRCPQATAFVERVLPRLQAIFRDELAAEAAAPGVSGGAP